MLEAGQPAPDFNAKDQNGDPISLGQFRGKKVVLYFYPRDNTPGCTAQACDLRDNYDRLQAAGYQVIGVSTDNEKKHQNFIAKYSLPFPLIADTDNAVHELYGTWQLKKNYGKEYMGTVRTTFLIDENGMITEVIKKVKTKEHTAQVLPE
ncbi:peroxiredoxin [Marinobacterium zhoushanense]|uniref:thioredoxin-dependent peroxiredoxin n=1 Tax=Marinobacterium zhoushanense TaxID=1679163 RepID=A0ABQ1KNI2_9GAMM|nr:thioredoxin-dependent thiol peroxidase [Marinobacterium zhoushanense]GGC02562.1 peroxiredoxin [Marinobacterium zhoushanense]